MGRCGSRFEEVLELELGRLAAASADIVDIVDFGWWD